MRNRSWLLLSLLACGISALYMFRILLPWINYVDVGTGRLKAQMGDLYPRWVGTRELLRNGRNPYAPDVSHEIQMAFYGHAIDQTYEKPLASVVDEQRFAYPVYVVFLLAPSIYLDFSLLQALALAILTVMTALSVPLWLGVLRWRPPGTVVAAIILFVLSSPQVVQGLRLRQLGLVVAFMLALSAFCVARDQLAVGGVALAFATIKPQMALFPALWLVLWSVGEWRRRWPLLAGFGITLATLSGLGEILLPRWPTYFVDGLIAYRKYFPSLSLLEFALGTAAGRLVSAIAVIGLLAYAWQNRHSNALSPQFIQTLAAFFIAPTVILPLLIPFNQVLLLLPVMIILRDWALLPRIGRRFFGLLVAWPCIVSILFLLHSPRLDSTVRTPSIPSAATLIIPFIVIVLSGIGGRRYTASRLLDKDSASAVS
jgi:Glycosyltransferase family 87